MPRFDSPLDNIRVASPCPANWNEMYGDERKRFCGDCKLNVYNLSGMTKAEAEALVINAEGRLCVRYYKRADGSVITSDCPVGWARVKQRTKTYVTAAFSLIMALLTGIFFVSLISGKRGSSNPLPIPFPKFEQEPMMGAISQNTVMGNIAVTNSASAGYTTGKLLLPKD